MPPASSPRRCLRRALGAAPLFALFASGCVVVEELGDCRHRERREAVVPAAPGLRRVEVLALAGSLVIQGRPDAAGVRVEGVACTRHRRHLDGIEIATRVERDRIVVEAVIPEVARRRGARLDLTIEMPADHELVVTDTSGDVEIAGVAAVEIEDASGDLLLEDIPGAVVVDDRSGDVLIRNAGAVRLEDRSGDVVVRGAASVTVLSDGSGDLEIHDVAGDVVILDDGSGDIEVTGVGGDLRIDDAGSGDVEYRDVRGKIDVR